MKRAVAMAVVAAVGTAMVGAVQVWGEGGGTPSSLIPVPPCRLLDTRPAPDTVGPVSTPIPAGGELTQQVHGTNGNCIIPATATAVAMNVTAVGGTASSYLTVWPADAPRPLASSLNWVAGAPPTPNKVDVQLSTSGEFKIFNLAGSVNIIADVVGYYVPSGAAVAPACRSRRTAGRQPDTKGDTGEQGPQGVPGPAGPAGPSSPAGAVGPRPRSCWSCWSCW